MRLDDTVGRQIYSPLKITRSCPVQFTGRTSAGRIESMVDNFLDETKDIRSYLHDHELRIRTLERARWPMPTIGVLAGVAGAATGAVALFVR